LREVVYPVLKLREENQTFVKVEGEKIDFFPYMFAHSIFPMVMGLGARNEHMRLTGLPYK
jgi:hypothetical protein